MVEGIQDLGSRLLPQGDSSSRQEDLRRRETYSSRPRRPQDPYGGSPLAELGRSGGLFGRAGEQRTCSFFTLRALQARYAIAFLWLSSLLQSHRKDIAILCMPIFKNLFGLFYAHGYHLCLQYTSWNCINALSAAAKKVLLTLPAM